MGMGMGLIAAASFCCRGIQRYVKRPRFGKKDSKVPKDLGSIDFSKSHQASLLENGVPTESLEKVIPNSSLPNISNSASYPIFKDLIDLPRGFRGQLNVEGNFAHNLHDIDVELNKFDAMEGVDGNLEMLPNEESIIPTKFDIDFIHDLIDLPRGFRGQLNVEGNFAHNLHDIDVELNKFDAMEGVDGNLEMLPNEESIIPTKFDIDFIHVGSITQPSATCNSPSLINRSKRLPLGDFSNTLDSPMCTSIPLKPSWTHINRIPSVSEEKLEMWLEDSGCRDTVMRTWDRSIMGSPMEIVVTKLEACQKRLSQWSKHSFCHVKREIIEKKKMLKVAEHEVAQGKKCGVVP
nr:hypothetical protein CFP56_76878 [Quercus suber]